MSDANKLLDEALKLPPTARAALAHELLDTIDEEFDQSIDQVWRAEVRHRMEEMARGDVPSIPWSEARTLLHRGKGS